MKSRSGSGPWGGSSRVAELPWLSLVTVRGQSMVPALRPGDRVLATRVSARAGVPPGSVVLATWAEYPGLLAVKRVVRAVPGGYWVEGDNAYESDDSRTYGPASVLGVVRARCWPWPPRIPATNSG